MLTGLGLAMALAVVYLMVQSRAAPPLPVGEVEAAVSDVEPDVDLPIHAAGPVGAGVTFEIEKLGTLVAPISESGPRVEVFEVDGQFLPAVLVAGPATVDPATLTGRHIVEAASRRAGIEGGVFHRVVQLRNDAFDSAEVGDEDHAARASENDGRAVARTRLGSRRQLTGVVLTASDGEPVVGAKVWAGSSDLDGTPRTTRTDEQGAFEFESVPQGPGVPLVVVADGMATTLRVVTFEHPSDPYRVLVEPSASPVEIGLAARTDAADEAVVRAVPRGDGVPTSLRAFPFFLAALPQVHAEFFPDGSGAGLARLRADGSGRLTDLPADVDLTMWATHPSFGASASAEVRPRDGRLQSVLLRDPASASGQVVSSRVVGENGDPRAGVVVRATREGAGARVPTFALPPESHRGPVEVWTTTGDDGSFTLSLTAGADRLQLVGDPLDARLEVSIAAASSGDPLVLPHGLSLAVGGAHTAHGLMLPVQVRDGARRVRVGESTAWRLWLPERSFELVRYDRPTLVRVRWQATDSEQVHETLVAVVGETGFDHITRD